MTREEDEYILEDKKTYRDLIDGMNDTVWMISFDGTLLDVNKRALEVLGYTKEELLSIGLYGIDSLLKKEAITALAGKMPEDRIQIFETTHKAKNGRIIPVEVSSSIITYRGEKIILSIARDISERKKAELLLMEQSNALQDLNATKDKVFSIIAHDLKGPFNAIIGLTDLLLQNYKELNAEQLRKTLQVIAGSSNQAYTLLENLLLWSRAQTGSMKYLPVKIRLDQVIKETIQLLHIQMNKKELRQVNNVPGDLFLLADKNMTETIIRNLLSNAIKFTPRGGEILLEAIKKEDMAEISVIDNGVGIPPAHLGQLFQTGSTITTTGTEKEKGSGLGLILCKEFVEKHGGRIWAESPAGKGSAFRFTLPLFTDKF